jgi:hypothetical protein
VAQGVSAGRFLNDVSAHPVGDATEKNQSTEIAMSLNSASLAEAEAELPSVLAHIRIESEAHAREYAAGFLLMIAMRPDGADLLASKSEEVSSLLLDADPGIQHVALGIAAYVIGRGRTNNQPYMSAMKAAIRMQRTPQDVSDQIIYPLLIFARGDSEALSAVMAFLQRDDLTVSTRSDVVHFLRGVPDLPEEVTQYLVARLDDPDPHVRAAAVVSYADSTTAYHIAAKDRVERMANDPQENSDVQELARKAIAGETNLSPNINLRADH